MARELSVETGTLEVEVCNSYKEPLETMGALKDSLLIRRGISNFYCGKSKSFDVLLDAKANLSSAKELGKPKNPYSTKRKKLLSLTNQKKRHANSSSKIEGAPWASPLVEELTRTLFE
ncbi:hypothetical protein IEQ34_017001 [Dendrobium chrysotoxum]|uniref:Uncharacterized protein n=1 Tax=Dendrobium chrysotoxum TaxID=161865 RepID=A0AAV7GGR6_DENCH|nr:hypothetical protein IEQ34_017001 [Dendrobium chrysotoxum]